MRLIRCGLSQYQTLQYQWRLTSVLRRTAVPPRTCQTRGLFLPTGIRPRKASFVESFFPARSPHDVLPASSSEETEEDILARAKAYNITTAQLIAFESDVLPDHNRKTYVDGGRLVDQQPYKEDFYLWTIFLDWRKLKYGDKGVRLIWEGMKYRCGSIDLPFIGYQGDRLWSAFVSTGTRNHRFLEEVVRYELRKGCHRPHFFLEVVGELLRSKSPKSPSAAKSFARMLRASHPPSKDEVFDLFVLASTAKDTTSLPLFCDIYFSLPSANLYGRAIAYLCAQKRFSDAWTMHRYLLDSDDLPQSFEELKPLVSDLVDNNMRLESLLHELANVGVSMESQARTFYAQERSLRFGFSSENLNIVSSRTLGVQPRALSDDFVARAFLTATFSFDAVLGALRFVGLRTVGPSGMRAMGLTSASSRELLVKFAKLGKLDIDTGSSRFSRTVKKLAHQGDETLLQDLLRSDQHPDVFEDLNLQRRLLLEYYREKNWSSVNRTLAILTVSSRGKKGREEAANLLLRAALSARNWSHAQQIMAAMSKNGHICHQITVDRMYLSVLSKRDPGRLPLARSNFDDLGFLVWIWLGVLRSGGRIPVAYWREPLRRLGMCGRLKELETLLIRLVRRYGKEHGTQQAAVGHFDAGDVRQLLSPQLQSAIVAWGFIHTRHLKPLVCPGLPFGVLRKQQPWSRGVLFLRRLQDRHGCDIDPTAVRKACLLRLRQVFHRRTESILLRNRRVFYRNRLPLWLYVEALDRAWSEPLFPDKLQLWKAVTIQAPVGSRHRRRIALRRQLGKHISRPDAAPVGGFPGTHIGHTIDSFQQSLPAEVVIPGGPLSQAYWSLK